MTRKRCCLCKRKRPDPASRAAGEGWSGCRVMTRGQKSHWICPLHETSTVLRASVHAEAVADGKIVCEVA